jgi:Zn-dependent protease
LDFSGEHGTLAAGLVLLGLALTWLTGWGGYLGHRNSIQVTWTPQAIFLAVISVGIAVAFWGITGGIAIIGAVMWHEWGHVIAYRVAGHDDARFRLIPLFGGVAISDQSPKNQAASCFVTLMGPGFSVSLVVLLVLAEGWLREAGSPYARDLHIAAVLTAAINAFNMLPLWPLDGGRALRAITVTIAPGLAGILTTVMSAVLAAIAVMKQMWLLLFFAIMGYGSVKQAAIADKHLRPMTGPQTVLASVGYLAILGAHVVIGLPLFLHLLQY